MLKSHSLRATLPQTFTVKPSLPTSSVFGVVHVLYRAYCYYRYKYKDIPSYKDRGV